MKPSILASKLKDHVQENLSVMLWGPPGIGKSDIVRSVADDLGYELLDIRAVLLDPTDIRGIPYVTDGELRMSQPSIFPAKKQGSKPWLLFLDEIVLAPPATQSALFQLILDRQIGDYKLPTDTRIIAAGNRQQDRSGANRMLSALSNRFVHYDMEVDFDDWIAWANNHNIHEHVISFIRFKPNNLNDFNANERCFPSPRAWEFISQTIPNLRKESEYETLSGIIGKGAAGEFIAYLKTAANLPDIDDWIENPDKYKVPDDPATTYALSGSLSTRAKPEKWTNLLKIINKLPPEFQVITVKDSVAKDRTLADSTEFRDWITKNTSILI